MSNALVAAKRTLFAIAPGGSGHEVVLSIGVPFLHPQGYWTAAVSFGILEQRNHEIAGVDGWQVVQLAMRFTATMFHTMRRRAGNSIGSAMGRGLPLPTLHCLFLIRPRRW